MNDNYLEGILGLNNPSDNPEHVGKSDFSRKRLFSLLKNSKQDSQGISPLNIVSLPSHLMLTRPTL